MEIVAYLGSILLANWLVYQFGLVSFLGLTFPAGAVAIGLTFTARDFVQRKHGKWGCWIWMGVASIITTAFNPQLAVASLAAFVVAEGADWAVYTFLPSSFTSRVITSNIVSTPLDSLTFVVLAFGINWPAVVGQTVVKFVCSIAVLLTAQAMQPLAREVA